MSSATATPAMPGLAARLANVRVGVREDLEITRHVFRGRPAYVVRDPVTFQSHRLDPADYDALVRLHADAPLSQHFDEHVNAKRFEADQAEEFYQFVFSLHRLGFLALPMADEKGLYRRNQQREESRRRSWWMSLISLRVPLVNPDRFLNATLPWMRWLFSPAFVCIWVLFMMMAGGIAWARAADLYEPVSGLLSTQSLPITWSVLILLKMWHELGHACACKHFGAHVPEIGANLIMLTPCAYVDASAAWGLPRKRERIIISLAGMYFESMLAGIAVLVWAFTPPGLANSVAYNVIFLASVVTVLFNVNPLMRYDGYYVLSDLLGIPNLSQRARQLLLNLAKRWLLGVATGPVADDRVSAVLLAIYGVAAGTFQTLLLFSIAALVATKFFLIGMTLGGAYIASSLGRKLLALWRYALRSDETTAVRPRAVMIAAAAVLVPVALLLFAPAQFAVVTPARVYAGEEVVVRPTVPGFLENLASEPFVDRGDELARLSNPELVQSLTQVQLAVEAAETRIAALEFSDPGSARVEQASLAALRAERDLRAREVEELTIRAPFSGRLAVAPHTEESGRYVTTGAPLVTLVRGQSQVRALLSELEYTDAQVKPGTPVEFRPADNPERTLSGIVTRVSPTGSRTIEIASLTHKSGGDIAVDPLSGQAQQAYFEVVITLTTDAGRPPPHGVSGRVRFPTRGDTLGLSAYRALRRFIDRLAQA